MPAREERKVLKRGNSGVVVIPKPYRDYFDLKPGSKVIVLYDSIVLIILDKLDHLLEEKKEQINKLLRS